MKPGDNLCYVVDGKVESVTFCKEYKSSEHDDEILYIAKDSTGTTFFDDKKFFHEDPKDAFVAYLEHLRESMTYAEKELDEAFADISALVAHISSLAVNIDKAESSIRFLDSISSKARDSNDANTTNTQTHKNDEGK